MKFTKMHGCANDYVYVNCFSEKVTDMGAFAKKVSDRHTGVGSDGAIFICPSDEAECEMKMYNADGSYSEMCGNGLRCVAKYVFDNNIVDKREFSILSGGRIKYVQLEVAPEEVKELSGVTFTKRADGLAVKRVRVDMGEPVLECKDIPVKPDDVNAKKHTGEGCINDGVKKNTDDKGTVCCFEKKDRDISVEMHVEGGPAGMRENRDDGMCIDKDIAMCVNRDIDKCVDKDIDVCVDRDICVGGKVYKMTCVSMGNPHCVVYVEDEKSINIDETGPLFENHKCFPNRVNTEFSRVSDRKNVWMRVWERGAGETLACGTGACAVAVASILNGFTEDEVTIHLLGGDLEIFWDRKSTNHVYMTGEAVTVFEGEI